MGQPRRRFPGGSVGKYFVATGPDFLTEAEAMLSAKKLANNLQKIIVVGKYVSHATPEEPDA